MLLSKYREWDSPAGLVITISCQSHTRDGRPGVAYGVIDPSQDRRERWPGRWVTRKDIKRWARRGAAKDAERLFQVAGRVVHDDPHVAAHVFSEAAS